MLTRIKIEPSILLKRLIPGLSIGHLANKMAHPWFFTKKTLYWAHQAEGMATIIPCMSDRFEGDWSSTFQGYTGDQRGYKIVLALGRYPKLNLHMERSSLFVGAGDGRHQSLSGKMKIASAFASLGRCISGNSTNICIGNKTFFSMGMDCMIAHDVRIRNTSGHVFIKLSDGLPLTSIPEELHTYAGNAVIEPHVWFGESSRVFFPREARIGLGAIVKYAGLATSGCDQLMTFDPNGNVYPISSMWARSSKKRDVKMAKILLESRDAIASCEPFGLLKNVSQEDLVSMVWQNIMSVSPC